MPGRDPGDLSERFADTLLRGVLHDALREGPRDASDEELAVVAAKGIEGLPEGSRDRVLRAIATEHDGANAVFDISRALHAAGSASSEIEQKPDPVGTQRDVIARIGLWDRYVVPALGLAACLFVASSVGFVLDSGGGGASGRGGVEISGQSVQGPTPAPVLQEDATGSETSGRLLWTIGLIIGGGGVIVLFPSAWKRFRGA